MNTPNSEVTFQLQEKINNLLEKLTSPTFEVPESKNGYALVWVEPYDGYESSFTQYLVPLLKVPKGFKEALKILSTEVIFSNKKPFIDLFELMDSTWLKPEYKFQDTFLHISENFENAEAFKVDFYCKLEIVL